MPALKYDVIYRDLKRKILSGEYAYDTCLPSEHECVKIYGAARNTIRRAIKKLEAEGYVLSRHGYGVKVIFQLLASPLYIYDPLESFHDFALRYHLQVNTKLIMMQKIAVDDNIAKQSGFAIGTPLLLLMRLRSINDQAVILEINMLDYFVYQHLDRLQAESSLHEYLEKHGYLIKACGYDVSSEMAANLDREYLNKQASIMQVVRKHLYNQESQLIDYSEVRALPELFRFHYHTIVY